MTVATTSIKKNWAEAAQHLSSTPWTEEVLPLADLKVLRMTEFAEGYQRVQDERRVDWIVENFDAGEARTIYVSRRKNGSLVTLDGQHTAAALMKMGIHHWMCRVFEGLTPRQEAQRFEHYQSNTRPIDPVTRWNARVRGGDLRTVVLEKLLESMGLRIGTATLRQKEGLLTVGAQAAFQKVYEFGEKTDQGGDLALTKTLTILREAFGHSKNTYQSRVVTGMGYLLCYAKPPKGQDEAIDLRRLVEVLKLSTTPNRIVDSMGSKAGGASAGQVGAEVLLNIYRIGAEGYPMLAHKDSPTLPARKARSMV